MLEGKGRIEKKGTDLFIHDSQYISTILILSIEPVILLNIVVSIAFKSFPMSLPFLSYTLIMRPVSCISSFSN